MTHVTSQLDLEAEIAKQLSLEGEAVIPGDVLKSIFALGKLLNSAQATIFCARNLLYAEYNLEKDVCYFYRKRIVY